MRWIAIWMFSTGCVSGQLAWETRQLDFKPPIEERGLTARFKFANTGNRPVKILALETSCGCTTAGVSKEVFAPGEKGEVKVDFLFGGRRGPQHKTVVVRTDDASNPSTVLALNVDIVELVKIRPGFVFWRRGAPKNPQTLTVRARDAGAVEVKSIVSDHPAMRARVETVDPGREYEIVVTPLSTDQSVLSTLQLVVADASGRLQTYEAYAQVK